MTTRPSSWQEERRMIGRALVTAGLFLQATITIKWLTPDRLDPSDAQRLIGALIGLMAALQGNLTPKLLPRARALSCDPSTEQALRRFAGWTLTLGGVGYSLAWILAPIDSAQGIAVSLMGASLLVTLVRVGTVGLGRGKGQGD